MADVRFRAVRRILREIRVPTRRDHPARIVAGRVRGHAERHRVRIHRRRPRHPHEPRPGRAQHRLHHRHRPPAALDRAKRARQPKDRRRGVPTRAPSQVSSADGAGLAAAASAQLIETLFGYAVTQTVAATAGLGIPDLLAEGPRPVEELAAAAGAVPDALARLLRAGVAVGLVDAVRTGRSAFRAVHGVDSWEYFRGHPSEGQLFAEAMSGLTA